MSIIKLFLIFIFIYFLFTLFKVILKVSRNVKKNVNNTKDAKMSEAGKKSTTIVLDKDQYKVE
ncbi:MAG: hypothetical protein JXN64_10735 [Spirochaetes bacterium]|nr:hypothetical protein [Spirochaetota bacterium]